MVDRRTWVGRVLALYILVIRATCSVNGVQLVVAALTCGGSLNRVIDVLICRVDKQVAIVTDRHLRDQQHVNIILGMAWFIL